MMQNISVKLFEFGPVIQMSFENFIFFGGVKLFMQCWQRAS